MEKVKKRHGFLTVFLIFVFFANLVLFLLYIFGRNNPGFQELGSVWVVVLLGLMSLANMVFVVALFKFKKWGYWGIVVVTILIFLLNITFTGSPFWNSASGLLMIPLLYGILQIGKENKGWKQLD